MPEGHAMLLHHLVTLMCAGSGADDSEAGRGGRVPHGVHEAC